MKDSARAGRFLLVCLAKRCYGRPARTSTTASRTLRSTGHWEPPGKTVCSSYLMDVSRQQDSWLPLLQEAERRLKAITGNSINLKASPLLEQVKTLVPWKLQRAQIFRSPKQRRLPQEVQLEGAKHRGAALWFNDDAVGIEAEEIKSIIQASSSRYDKPVRLAIYFYGIAPATSLNEQDNAKPEPPAQRAQVPEPEEERKMLPHQPGYRDITFPGVDIPLWVQQVLRRLHCNLGHPPKEVLVRQLAIVRVKASNAALQGARHLRCEVCLPVLLTNHVPRMPSRPRGSTTAWVSTSSMSRTCAAVPICS